MESDQSLYPQSPQPVGRVLDAGFQIFRTGFKAVLPLSVVTSVLINLPQFAQAAAGGAEGSMVLAVAVLVLFVGGILLYLAGDMGMLVALDRIARGGPAPSLAELFGIGLRRLAPGLGATVLYMLAVTLGLLLLLIPGLILMISLAMVWPYLVVDRRGVVESLKASHTLIWGHWWRTTAVFTVAVLIYYIPMLLIGSIIGFIAATSEVAGAVQGSPALNIATLLIAVLSQTLVTALLMPLLNAIIMVQFNDLKLRRSGSDLLARASA
ncbi:MAG: hypothetical protein ACT4QA_02115 [Panacagrimonas sp.]